MNLATTSCLAMHLIIRQWDERQTLHSCWPFTMVGGHWGRVLVVLDGGWALGRLGMEHVPTLGAALILQQVPHGAVWLGGSNRSTTSCLI
jgi:hypothetical protein